MAGKRQDIVVFRILRDSSCAECGEELRRGSLLTKEEDRALCLSCADLDHLWFLPSGDAALTRRASKHSTLRAVVLKFSRARKRYERRGILVEQEAVERAEEECASDADARARAREKAAARRAELDKVYVASFAEAVQRTFPGCPDKSVTSIAAHACRKYSGRVGRSAAAKDLAPEAVRLAVIAHVRHSHTNYDTLLAGGHARVDARREIRATVDQVLAAWS